MLLEEKIKKVNKEILLLNRSLYNRFDDATTNSLIRMEIASLENYHQILIEKRTYLNRMRLTTYNPELISFLDNPDTEGGLYENGPEIITDGKIRQPQEGDPIPKDFLKSPFESLSKHDKIQVEDVMSKEDYDKAIEKIEDGFVERWRNKDIIRDVTPYDGIKGNKSQGLLNQLNDKFESLTEEEKAYNRSPAALKQALQEYFKSDQRGITYLNHTGNPLNYDHSGRANTEN